MEADDMEANSQYDSRPSVKVLLWYLIVLPALTYFSVSTFLFHTSTLRQGIVATCAAALPWTLSGIVLHVLAKTPVQKSWRMKVLIIPSVVFPILLVSYHLIGIISYYGWETLARMLRA